MSNKRKRVNIDNDIITLRKILINTKIEILHQNKDCDEINKYCDKLGVIFDSIEVDINKLANVDISNSNYRWYYKFNSTINRSPLFSQIYNEGLIKGIWRDTIKPKKNKLNMHDCQLNLCQINQLKSSPIPNNALNDLRNNQLHEYFPDNICLLDENKYNDDDKWVNFNQLTSDINNQLINHHDIHNQSNDDTHNQLNEHNVNNPLFDNANNSLHVEFSFCFCFCFVFLDLDLTFVCILINNRYTKNPQNQRKEIKKKKILKYALNLLNDIGIKQTIDNNIYNNNLIGLFHQQIFVLSGNFQNTKSHNSLIKIIHDNAGSVVEDIDDQTSAVIVGAHIQKKQIYKTNNIKCIKATIWEIPVLDEDYIHTSVNDGVLVDMIDYRFILQLKKFDKHIVKKYKQEINNFINKKKNIKCTGCECSINHAYWGIPCSVDKCEYFGHATCCMLYAYDTKKPLCPFHYEQLYATSAPSIIYPNDNIKCISIIKQKQKQKQKYFFIYNAHQIYTKCSNDLLTNLELKQIENTSNTFGTID